MCCEGGGRELLLGARNSPLFTNAASASATGRQPRLLRCNWRTTLAPGTHDRLSSARSRPTLALSSRAHGAGSDESSAGPAIITRQDDSWPPHRPQYATAHSLMILSPLLCSPLVPNLISPFVILKKHTRRNITVTARPPSPTTHWYATAASAK